MKFSGAPILGLTVAGIVAQNHAIPNVFDYYGCVAIDIDYRGSTDIEMIVDPLTAENCQSTCAKYGYNWAAVFFDDCHCGIDAVPATQIDEAKCDNPCQNDWSLGACGHNSTHDGLSYANLYTKCGKNGFPSQSPALAPPVSVITVPASGPSVSTGLTTVFITPGATAPSDVTGTAVTPQGPITETISGGASLVTVTIFPSGQTTLQTETTGAPASEVTVTIFPQTETPGTQESGVTVTETAGAPASGVTITETAGVPVSGTIVTATAGAPASEVTVTTIPSPPSETSGAPASEVTITISPSGPQTVTSAAETGASVTMTLSPPGNTEAATSGETGSTMVTIIPPGTGSQPTPPAGDSASTLTLTVLPSPGTDTQPPTPAGGNVATLVTVTITPGSPGSPPATPNSKAATVTVTLLPPVGTQTVASEEATLVTITLAPSVSTETGPTTPLTGPIGSVTILPSQIMPGASAPMLPPGDEFTPMPTPTVTVFPSETASQPSGPDGESGPVTVTITPSVVVPGQSQPETTGPTIVLSDSAGAPQETATPTAPGGSAPSVTDAQTVTTIVSSTQGTETSTNVVPYPTDPYNSPSDGLTTVTTSSEGSSGTSSAMADNHAGDIEGSHGHPANFPVDSSQSKLFGHSYAARVMMAVMVLMV